MKGRNPKRLKKKWEYLRYTLHLVSFLLDFAEDDVHVGEGDILAVNHATVFAEFGPVLAMHFFAGSASVTVDGKASKCLFQSCHFHWCGRPHASFTGPIRLR